tara:strand:+ start:622 stop:828 length:207 start_codon:yes stop_codon:yes gene_type:complete
MMNKLEQTISFLSNMDGIFYQDFLNSQQHSDKLTIDMKRDEVKILRKAISILEMERETFEEGDYDNGI